MGSGAAVTAGRCRGGGKSRTGAGFRGPTTAGSTRASCRRLRVAASNGGLCGYAVGATGPNIFASRLPTQRPRYDDSPGGGRRKRSNSEKQSEGCTGGRIFWREMVAGARRRRAGRGSTPIARYTRGVAGGVALLRCLNDKAERVGNGAWARRKCQSSALVS